MKHYPIVLLGACILAACQPAPEAGDPAPTQAAENEAEAIDLQGEWGISRLRGETLDFRITFSGDRAALIWQPACAGQGIRYRAAGGQLEFYQPERAGPQIVCDIGFPADLPVVLDYLEGRWDAVRQDNGDLTLTRAGERLTLERLPLEKVETLAGHWRVAGIDGEALNERTAIALRADESEIWWEPRCAGASVPYRTVNERFIIVPAPEAPPPPPGTEPVPPPPVCAIGLPPRLSDAMNAIRVADTIERTPENAVRLSGGGRSITLFSQ